MARKDGSQNPPTNTTTLPLRPHTPSRQPHSSTPTTAPLIPTHADRCPYPSCTNTSPHRHPPTEGALSPSVEEYRKASSATRQQWTSEQRRRIAENEARLDHLAASITPTAGKTSMTTHLPRGNDLTVQEQIAIIHGSSTPSPHADPLQRPHPHPIDHTAASSLEWNDFPELDAKYANTTNFTLPREIHNPCTGPCPIQTPHERGAYLQRGPVPRVWNARWGYSDPPRRIWEAWVRVERGRGSSWDRVEVDGFAGSHRWGG